MIGCIAFMVSEANANLAKCYWLGQNRAFKNKLIYVQATAFFYMRKRKKLSLQDAQQTRKVNRLVYEKLGKNVRITINCTS